MAKLRHNMATVTGNDALNGRWYKYDDGFVRITVLRDLMFIVSRVADRTKTVDIDLPGHPAFILEIIGQAWSGIPVGENGKISTTLSPGQMIKGVVALSYDSKSLT